MTYPVYAIRDDKTQFMALLMTEQNDFAAKRQFDLMINSSMTIMSQNPGDFTLYKVADFDSETGEIVPKWPIEFIVNGVSVSA